MKKFFAASLAILLCLAMFSCGKAEINHSVIAYDGTASVKVQRFSGMLPAALQHERTAKETTESKETVKSDEFIKSEDTVKSKEVERIEIYSKLLAKRSDYYKSITAGTNYDGLNCEINDNQVRVLVENDRFWNCSYIKEISKTCNKAAFRSFDWEWENATEISESTYKIISSAEELPDFSWNIKEVSESAKAIDKSIFEDNVIILTTRMYGTLVTPAGFKNLAFRDGKMVIVADLDNMIGTGCDAMDYYVDLIIVPKSEIPEGTQKEGRIEILNRYLLGTIS